MEIRKNVIILQAWDSDEGHRTSKKLIQELDKGIYTDLIIVSPQEYEVNWKEHINASAKALFCSSSLLSFFGRKIFALSNPRFSSPSSSSSPVSS